MTKSRPGELQAFAKRIEQRIIEANRKGSEDMERLVCRLLTGSNPQIAAKLVEKWVEWRYGKAKERIEHSSAEGGPIEHVWRFVDRRRRAVTVQAIYREGDR